MAYDKYVDEKELKMRITLHMKKLEGTMLMDPIGSVLLRCLLGGWSHDCANWLFD